MFKKTKKASCAVAALIFCGGQALADEVVAPAGEVGEKVNEPEAEVDAQARMNSVVVTARKRDETIQDVPISIGVVSGEAIANTGATSLLEIESIAPGVNFTKAPTGTEVGITIRGLGSAPGAPSFDSSVSLFVDGIFAPRGREFASAMFDVERIEVIKGTQAALLGKNTSLGAVNLIVRKPGDVFSAEARAAYESEYGGTQLAGAVDLPLSDTLSLRLSGQSVRDDGYVKNIVSGGSAYEHSDDSIRAVAVWRPTPSLDLTGFVQYNKVGVDGATTEFVSLNDTALSLAAMAGAPGSLDASLNRVNATSMRTIGDVPEENIDFARYGLTADYELGDFTLTSITGYSEYSQELETDVDFMPGDYFHRNSSDDSTNLSQEIRLLSPVDRRFDFVVGALYIHNTLDIMVNNDVDYPFGPAPGVNLAGRFQTNFDQTTDTYSVFGQANYHLTERLTATGGLRYTKEEKSADMSRIVLEPGFYSTVANPPYAPFTFERSDEPVDYSAGLQYELSDNVLIYASYGKGTKSGGFASSATLLDESEYERETARTKEAGIKSRAADGRWLLNLSLFDTDVEDFQVVTFNGSAFEIFNTNLNSRGFELQAEWYPVEAVKIYINNTYADAKDDNTGEAIPLAPEWAGAGGVYLRTPIAAGIDFILDGSINYRSSRTYQQNPDAAMISQAFTPVNLSLAVADIEDRWDVRLIGRNLYDEIEPAFAFPTPVIGTQSAIPERGRTVALQVSARF